jgi:hypothetical protein
MLGRANAGREWLRGGFIDESFAFAESLANVWVLSFGEESLAMCGSACRWDAVASDSGACDHVSPGARG